MKSKMNIVDMSTLKPNTGIGPFLFGKEIKPFLSDDYYSLQKGYDNGLLNTKLENDTYSIHYEGKVLLIYVGRNGKIEDFNTELLYYNNESLIDINIASVARILDIAKWDKEEYFNVLGSLQKIYYYDKFGLMFWTSDDIVRNISVSQDKGEKDPFKKIIDKYDLDLDEMWKKVFMPYKGRYRYKYHNEVLQRMKRAADEAGDDKAKFLKLYKKYIIDWVSRNPM